MGQVFAQIDEAGVNQFFVKVFNQLAVLPTDDTLHALLQTVIARLMKMLTRRGVLVEDMGQTYVAEPDADGEEVRT